MVARRVVSPPYPWVVLTQIVVPSQSQSPSHQNHGDHRPHVKRQNQIVRQGLRARLPRDQAKNDQHRLGQNRLHKYVRRAFG